MVAPVEGVWACAFRDRFACKKDAIEATDDAFRPSRQPYHQDLAGAADVPPDLVAEVLGDARELLAELTGAVAG